MTDKVTEPGNCYSLVDDCNFAKNNFLGEKPKTWKQSKCYLLSLVFMGCMITIDCYWVLFLKLCEDEKMLGLVVWLKKIHICNKKCYCFLTSVAVFITALCFKGGKGR